MNDKGKYRENDDHFSHHLRNPEDRYVLDVSSGSYKPKAEQEATHIGEDNCNTISVTVPENKPTWTDIASVIIASLALIVATLTLVGLALTVRYAHKQWIEAQRTAKASEDAARAAADASTTAKNTLDLTRQEFASSEAAVLQPNVSIRDLGKRPFVQIDIINSGRIAATHVSGGITVSNHQPLQLSHLIVTARSTSPDYPSGFITRTVPLGVTLDTQVLAAQHFKVSGELDYWNGLEKVRNSFCLGLTASPYTGAPNWYDCENPTRLQQVSK